MKADYDMIVIGGGAAGLTAAGMSALLGAKTALIEEHRLGGECTWVGCVPSKTLLKAAKVAHEMRTAHRFGLTPIDVDVPFASVMDHVRRTRQQIYEDADAPPHMEKLGVEVVQGRATFVDPHTVEVSDRRISSRKFVIATGSRPIRPPFAEHCLTNESLFELTSLPKRLVVMGAGPIGIEMAQAYARLGSNVTVVAPDPSILPKDDPSHTAVLQGCLSGEGITFELGRKITGVEKTAQGLTAKLDNGRTLDCDSVLAALGREPNVAALNPAAANVKTGDHGIIVDSHCRTSQKHIFAVGDVTGRYQFTHMAEHTSKVAVTNAMLHWPKSVDFKHVVWCTFTDPELAHLGESEASLAERGVRHAVYRFPYRQLDRAITESETAGEVKVLATTSGRILGVSIVGVNAGEMIAEYALAMKNGITLARIAGTIHPYPTYMLGNRRAADLATIQALDSPWLGVLGRLFGYRGVRKGSAALKPK